MKNTRNVKNVKGVKNVLLLTAVFALASLATANPAKTLPPKQRVEREFRQLELALARCIYEEVIPSPDLDYMSRALFEFMRENPGVQRVVRVNAGGYTVNDVSAEAPVSAPARNVGGQRWFQHVTESDRPYYSMDSDSEGGSIILFYAWPLNTGVDGARPSGAFAAMIDFTAQVALIDDVEPFQLAFRGRPFFQHDWDEVDYNEEALDVRGAREITVRTMKPLPTRLDPRAPSAARQSGRIGGGPVAGVGSAFLGGDDPDSDGDDSGGAPKKSGRAGLGASSGWIMNAAVFALLLLIAVMLAYSIFKERAGKAERSAADDPPPPPRPAEDRVIVRSMSDAAPAGRADGGGTELVDVADGVDNGKVDKGVSQVKDKPVEKRASQIVDDYDSKPTIKMVSVSDDGVEHLKIELSERERQTMSKMLKLIREDYAIMDEKIERLSKRIDDMERRR